MYKQNYITNDQFTLVETIFNDLPKYNNVQMSNAYDILFNMFRDLRILRWTSTEILIGNKIHIGKQFTLQEALKDETAVKIDMLALINGRFIEVTNYLMLAIEEESNLIPINIDIVKGNYPPIGLPPEIEKLYYSNMFYSPFKVVKRMFALARNIKNTNVLNNIIPFVSSNISLLYQLKSEIETIVRIIEIVHNPPIVAINTQLDEMKNRFASVLEIDKETLLKILETLDIVIENTNIDEKKNLLKKLNKLVIKPIINFHTIKYLDSVGYNPPPSDLMPKYHKYNRSYVRKPNEIPDESI